MDIIALLSIGMNVLLQIYHVIMIVIAILQKDNHSFIASAPLALLLNVLCYCSYERVSVTKMLKSRTSGVVLCPR